MLEKVITIQGVGLFEEASTPVDFGRVTLIYGENAKGKSTFAWILSNAARGDATQVRQWAQEVLDLIHGGL